MLKVNGLKKSYGSQIIFDGVTFSLNKGERVGVVGRNGHGKTTLFKIILGQEYADEGVVSVPDGYRIGHLSQHIHFTESSVLAECCLGLPNNDDGRDESYRAEKILSGLGFADAEFSINPYQLSGGYQVRLNLAKLLVSEPDLLLLDEPTNYLDIVSMRWLSGFLSSWRRELMIITHDRQFMDSVTTHTLCIHRQKARKVEGDTHKLYQQILMEEEVYEKTRVNDEKKRRETEQFINRFRAQATRARAVQSKIKLLGKKEQLQKMEQVRDLDFSFNAAPFQGKVLMDVKEISFSYSPESRPLINGLSFSIGKNDRIAIIGKNGRGKTTLLNILAGELSPTKGEVQRSPKLQSAYFGQTNVQRLNPAKTVEDEIIDIMPEYNRTRARTICGIMMFEGDTALKKISVLSGGEKSRVLLGKILVTPANLLMLDEPTNHLDMESTETLVEAIDAFDGAVAVVTHSEMMLNAVANRLIVFDGGGCFLFEGGYQEFLQRVGWSDERIVAPDKSSSGKVQQINKKEMRRLKAGIITARSRELSALEKKIQGVEQRIIELEARLENDNRLLVESSMNGDSDAIKSLSISVHECSSEIDRLFGELAGLSAQLDEKTREYEEKMGAFTE
ncbi:MAG: ABC-F family ATP-binding cassette domain-containing protein [Nitrospirae bacterium]|nr:ABC-F family ATP-binding cassette domain-containing protein [Nitrospirota bacterium]